MASIVIDPKEIPLHPLTHAPQLCYPIDEVTMVCNFTKRLISAGLLIIYRDNNKNLTLPLRSKKGRKKRIIKNEKEPRGSGNGSLSTQ